MNLSVSGVRGQVYDGAANVAGIYSGAQAIIKQHQSLAPYVHCGARCVNLITQFLLVSVTLCREFCLASRQK